MAAFASRSSPFALAVCSVCCESTSPGPVVVIENSPACFPCFKQLFLDAIQDESRYPARWGSLRLDVASFDSILPPDVKEAYEAKEPEYSCPPAERLYCERTVRSIVGAGSAGARCETFLGRRQDTDGATLDCDNCGGTTCARCGSVVRFGPQSHTCPRPDPSQQEEAAFEGLRRGIEYQICPSERCKRRVELMPGGCNHIECMCGQQLCYICGDPVTLGTGHWTKRTGKCPRYGRLGAHHWWDTERMDQRDVMGEGFQPAAHLRRNAIVPPLLGAPPTTWAGELPSLGDYNASVPSQEAGPLPSGSGGELTLNDGQEATGSPTSERDPPLNTGIDTDSDTQLSHSAQSATPDSHPGAAPSQVTYGFLHHRDSAELRRDLGNLTLTAETQRHQRGSGEEEENPDTES